MPFKSFGLEDEATIPSLEVGSAFPQATITTS